MIHSRRSFFMGLSAVLAAPAIVRAESLMKVVPTEIIQPSLREIATYAPLKAGEITRLDVLYGVKYTQPEWAIAPPLSLDQFAERILAPSINALSNRIADSFLFGSDDANPHVAGLAWLLKSTPSSE